MVDLYGYNGELSYPPCISNKHLHPMLRSSVPDSDETPVPPALRVAQLGPPYLGSESHIRLEARVGMCSESKAQWEIDMLFLGK